MKINVKMGDEFKNMEKFAKKLEIMARANIGEQFLNEIVKKCDSVTKKNTPRDKGILVNSWKWNKRGNAKNLEIDYYNNTDYGVYVEYGHRTRNHKGWVTGAFMLQKGVRAVERNRAKIAKDIIKKTYKAGKL